MHDLMPIHLRISRQIAMQVEALWKRNASDVQYIQTVQRVLVLEYC